MILRWSEGTRRLLLGCGQSSIGGVAGAWRSLVLIRGGLGVGHCLSDQEGDSPVGVPSPLQPCRCRRVFLLPNRQYYQDLVFGCTWSWREEQLFEGFLTGSPKTFELKKFSKNYCLCKLWLMNTIIKSPMWLTKNILNQLFFL